MLMSSRGVLRSRRLEIRHLNRHGVDLPGGQRDMVQQALAQMREVSIRVSRGRNTLIHLEYVNVCPRHVFIHERTQHHPWRMAAADSHDETAAGGNGLRAPPRRSTRQLSWHRIRVGKHFNSHGSSPLIQSLFQKLPKRGSRPCRLKSDDPRSRQQSYSDSVS